MVKDITVLKDLKLISIGQREHCSGPSLPKAGQPIFPRALPASGLQGAFTLCLCAAFPPGPDPVLLGGLQVCSGVESEG